MSGDGQIKPPRGDGQRQLEMTSTGELREGSLTLKDAAEPDSLGNISHGTYGKTGYAIVQEYPNIIFSRCDLGSA